MPSGIQSFPPTNAYTVGFKNLSPKPLDAYMGPWEALDGTTSSARTLALGQLAPGIRYQGQKIILIGNSNPGSGVTTAYIYWFRGGTGNNDFEEFASGSATGSEFVTGISAAGATFTRLVTAQAGISASHLWVANGATFAGLIYGLGGLSLNGNATFGGSVTATTFTGNLGGTADNATTLANVASTNYARKDQSNIFVNPSNIFRTTHANGAFLYPLTNFPAGTSVGTGLAFAVAGNAAFDGNVIIGPSGGQLEGGTTQGVVYIRSGTTFERAVDFAGAVRAATFTGNLGGTADNATNLANVAASNYARRDAANTFTNLQTLNSGLNVTSGGATFAGTLQVVGGSTLGGRVDVGGILDVVGGTTLESTLDVGGVARFASAVTLSGTASGATATFSRLVTAQQGLDVTSGGATFAGTVAVTGLGTFSGGLSAAGAVTVNGAATFNNTLSGTTATFSRLITAQQGISAAGGATFAGTVAVAGLGTFSGGLSAAGAVAINGAATFNSISAFGTLGAVTYPLANIPAGTSLGQGISFTVLQNAAFNGNVLIGPSGGQIVGGTTQGVMYVRVGTTFERAVDFAGAVRAATFTGDLAGTANNASNLGTIAASTYARRDAGNTFSVLQTLNAGLSAAGAITLNGAATVNNTLTITGSAANTTFDTVGNATIGATLTVNGNLFVNGTQTTVNSTNVQIDDKIFELGNNGIGGGSTGSDAAMDSSGIAVNTTGTPTQKTLLWKNDNSGAWTSNQHFNLDSGYAYRINGATALTATFLGSGVIGSSLASVGTVTSGTWNATAIGLAYGGAGANISALPTNGIIYKTATGLTATAAGTDGQVLFAGAAGLPAFASPTGLTVGTANKARVQDRNTTAGTMFLTFVADAGDAQDLWIDKASGITFDANTNLLSCTKIEATIDGGVWS
jgi:hypothetical protein